MHSFQRVWCWSYKDELRHGEGHTQAHYCRHVPGRTAQQSDKAAKGQWCSETLTWVNGGLTMHASHIGKGFSDWYCVLKRNWIAIVCSYFPVARVRNSSVHCLLEREVPFLLGASLPFLLTPSWFKFLLNTRKKWQKMVMNLIPKMGWACMVSEFATG